MFWNDQLAVSINLKGTVAAAAAAAAFGLKTHVRLDVLVLEVKGVLLSKSIAPKQSPQVFWSA